jgi:hypothetical protein
VTHHKTFPRARAAIPAWLGTARRGVALSPRASGNSRREESRGGAVDRAMAAARHLMQSAESQSATREMPVDLLDAEGQHQSPACGCALAALDALAKLLDNRKAGGRPHVLCNSLG